MFKTRKGVILGMVLLAVAVAVFAVIYALNTGAPAEGEKNITVTIIFADKSKKEVTIKTQAEYLRGALEEKQLIEGTDSEYGLFVSAVDGVTADSGRQEWWLFSKGGESLMTGVDVTPIEDGDSFEITLMVGW